VFESVLKSNYSLQSHFTHLSLILLYQIKYMHVSVNFPQIHTENRFENVLIVKKSVCALYFTVNDSKPLFFIMPENRIGLSPLSVSKIFFCDLLESVV